MNKMNKSLILEIKRIHQLLDKKQVLSESWLSRFSDELVDFFTSGVKKVGNDLLVNGEKITEKQYNDMIAVLEDPSLIGALDDVTFKILRRTLIKNQDLVNRQYLEFLNGMKNKNNTFSELTWFKQLMATSENQNRTISDILKNDYGITDEIRLSLIAKKIAQKDDEFIKTGKFTSEKVVSKTLPNTPIESNKWAAFVQQMGGDKIQSLWNIYRRTFTSIEKLQQEFIQVAQQVDGKIVNNLNPDTDLSKMVDILVATKKYFQEQPKRTFQQWKELIPTNVVDEIEKEGEKGYQKFFKAVMSDTRLGDAYATEMKAFAKSFTFLFSKKGSRMEAFKRFGKLLAITEPRTWDEIRLAILAKGVKQSVVSSLFTRIGIHVLFLASIGTLITLIRCLISWIEFITNAISGKDYDWIDYRETTPKYWEEFVKDMDRVFPDDLKTFFKDILQISLADEFFNYAILPILSGGVGDTYEKIRESLKKNRDENLRQIDSTLNNIPDPTLRDRLRQLLPTDSTTTTPTDTTTTTPPPSLTSDVQNFDSRWLNVATFTKVNENTYKMKFTTDQNKLSRNEIPSDWAGKETEAKKTNDGWVFTLGDQGPFPLEQ